MSNLFMSYYSEEEADAEDIARHLEGVFQDAGLEVFMASRPESVRPGDIWQDKVIDALSDADVLLVLMTFNALSRPWINFEIGVAWARRARILIFCNGGMTPAGLPTPYNTLQAVDINGMSHEVKLNRVTDAVASALDIRPSETSVPSVPRAGFSATFSRSIEATIRTWNRIPSANTGATADGEFLVGRVGPASISRARVAGFQAGEALFVRLFLGRAREGRYINAMAGGAAASFFDAITRDDVVVRASIRLAAIVEERDMATPLLVVDDVQEISGE